MKKESSAPINKQARRGRLGLKVARVRGRKVVILEVKPKSPAQSAGIRAGMEILEINGTKTAKLSWQEIVIGKLTDPNAKQIKLLCRPKNTTASTEYTITQK